MAIPNKPATEQTKNMRRFGQELRRRRLDAGYSVPADFAEEIGIALSHLSNIETAYAKPGAVPSVPKIETINRISELLKWPKLEMLQLLGIVTEEDLKEAPISGLGAFVDPNASRFLDTLEQFQAFFWWVDPDEAALWYYRQSKEKELQESTRNTNS